MGYYGVQKANAPLCSRRSIFVSRSLLSCDEANALGMTCLRFHGGKEVLNFRIVITRGGPRPMFTELFSCSFNCSFSRSASHSVVQPVIQSDVQDLPQGQTMQTIGTSA